MFNKDSESVLNVLQDSVAAKSQKGSTNGYNPSPSYNLFFLEDGCLGKWKMMVVNLSSL